MVAVEALDGIIAEMLLAEAHEGEAAALPSRTVARDVAVGDLCEAMVLEHAHHGTLRRRGRGMGEGQGQVGRGRVREHKGAPCTRASDCTRAYRFATTDWYVFTRGP